MEGKSVGPCFRKNWLLGYHGLTDYPTLYCLHMFMNFMNTFFLFQLQNISEQVASYMRDPSRMVRQMQMRKSAVAVFGVQFLKDCFGTIDSATSDCRRLIALCFCRYNVYEKIVNFMAPETMAISPMLPDLNNLFGLKKQKLAFIV
ncbi:protein AATF-like [Pyrus ussuriensis x Pyrus communis]|uniref:Protein AATF-like n=1 Tax=Pyrus ussuriensis x Pyrus communis TaxID=2448454 RepID=A0A5N5GY92_9ROSA|nr:protein AATF-like [Pyrus ussuriensis x Pyrus communis]